MRKERIEVVENVGVSQSFYRLTLRSSFIADRSRPGHFLQMRVSESYDPFLARPMSICRVRRDLVDILYIVVGAGTRVLSSIKPGMKLDVWGPLGTIFTPMPKKKLIYVSGGVGVAPMIFLASQMPVEAFLFGVRTAADLLPLSELGIDKSRLHVSSNDGSVGEKGYITDVFDRLAKNMNPREYFVYTCGPDPMMRLIVKTAKEKGLSGEASMEEVMACGVGACLGCVMDTKRGRITVCHEGPVLPFDVLTW
ncbi:MAG: dihydroorotate dehydrogenase electron transfer subunit [Candidatus Omnitrophica bacterium]|nr:dihydroorotate dehydrogenase electron transfer subunit [Candidatus Omnitrophota bacterium]